MALRLQRAAWVALVLLLLLILFCVVRATSCCGLRFAADNASLEEDLFRIYVGGEPTPWESPEPYDLCVLAGGSNRYPNAFHLPLLALEKGWTYDPPEEVSRSSIDVSQRPIDVFFRSSARCDHPRVAFAAHIQRRCLANNLQFVAAGKCLGGSGDSLSWGACDACWRSKIVLALEAFQEGWTYLSEKPFLPLTTGAAGVYVGNGSEMLEAAGVNFERFVFLGADYSLDSAERAFRSILAFLSSPATVVGSLSAPPFKGPPLTPETLDMSAVHDFLASNPKMERLRRLQRPLRCHFQGVAWSLLQNPSHLARLLRVPQIRACPGVEGADIVLKHCCAD